MLYGRSIAVTDGAPGAGPAQARVCGYSREPKPCARALSCLGQVVPKLSINTGVSGGPRSGMAPGPGLDGEIIRGVGYPVTSAPEA
jgi:hypothetical protein